MIVFGNRGLTYKEGEGDFFCPICREHRDFKHQRVRRFFTLYFIPCIPLDLIGECLECQACEGTFDLAVRDYDPREEQRRFEAQFHKAIRATMVQMTIVDGVVEDSEIETIREIYQGITSQPLDTADLREECASATPRDIAEVVGNYAATLNEHGKEMVLKAALQVAASDGDFANEERALAMAIAKAMEMSNAHAQGVIAEVLGS
jgi:tellurite resistance protein